MAKCPDAYVGLQEVECCNRSCRHFSDRQFRDTMARDAARDSASDGVTGEIGPYTEAAHACVLSYTFPVPNYERATARHALAEQTHKIAPTDSSAADVKYLRDKMTAAFELDCSNAYASDSYCAHVAEMLELEISHERAPADSIGGDVWYFRDKMTFAQRFGLGSGPAKPYVESSAVMLPVDADVAHYQAKVLAGLGLTKDQLAFSDPFTRALARDEATRAAQATRIQEQRRVRADRVVGQMKDFLREFKGKPNSVDALGQMFKGLVRILDENRPSDENVHDWFVRLCETKPTA